MIFRDLTIYYFKINTRFAVKVFNLHFIKEEKDTGGQKNPVNEFF